MSDGVAAAFAEAQAELGTTGALDDLTAGAETQVSTPAAVAEEAPAQAPEAGLEGEPTEDAQGAAEADDLPAEDDPFKDIPEDELTAEDKALKERLLADYHRKRQRDSERARTAEQAAEAKNAELEALRAELEALRAQVERPAQPQQEAQAPTNALPFDPYDGFENVLQAKDVNTRDDMAAFIRQEITAALRVNNFLMDQRVGQVISPVLETMSQQQYDTSLAEVNSFMESHPDVTDWGPVVEVMESHGLTIDRAFDVAFPEARIEAERQAAFELGRKTATRVNERKAAITVPRGGASSGVGTPKAGGDSITDFFHEAQEELKTANR